jgi:hypothetical protein
MAEGKPEKARTRIAEIGGRCVEMATIKSLDFLLPSAL